MKEIDTEAVAYHIRGLLEALGDDPDREGLKGNTATGCQNVRRSI